MNEEILKHYQQMLNLTNWEITAIEEPSLETDACCKMVYNDYKAIIRLKKELSDEKKEEALIHELLHCVHRDELDVVRDNMEDNKMADMYTRHHERSIEQMAKIIYKLSKEVIQ